MVSSSSPIDQFVVRHPSYFFDASPEHALVNPDNLHILVDHVKCAAFELPFTTEETYGQVNVQDVLGVLQESGLVHQSGAEDEAGQWNWTSESYPAECREPAVGLVGSFRDHRSHRRPQGDRRDRFQQRALDPAPEGDLHGGGQDYQVEELDFVGRKAHVREVDCDYYTDGHHLYEGQHPRSLRVGPTSPLHGEVHVVSRVVGFKKIRFHTNENVGSGELDLPEQQMHTTSYWLEVPLDGDERAALRDRRPPRRRRRPRLCDEAGGAAAPDVRRARHRLVGEHR